MSQKNKIKKRFDTEKPIKIYYKNSRLNIDCYYYSENLCAANTMKELAEELDDFDNFFDDGEIVDDIEILKFFNDCNYIKNDLIDEVNLIISYNTYKGKISYLVKTFKEAREKFGFQPGEY